MKKLDGLINQVLTKLYNKQGPIIADLIINWSKIVGNEFVNNTSPSRIRSQVYKGKKINILYVNVKDSSKAIEISYSENLILERMAVFLCKRVIHRIKIQAFSNSDEIID